jgi:hypothetical protein
MGEVFVMKEDIVGCEVVSMLVTRCGVELVGLVFATWTLDRSKVCCVKIALEESVLIWCNYFDKSCVFSLLIMNATG